jgi:hypothetical protein
VLATLGFLSSFSKIDWVSYWSRIVTGDGLDQHTGAWSYRRLLIGNLQSTNKKITPDVLLLFGVVAFNKDLDGEKCKVLRLPSGYQQMYNVPHKDLLEFFRLDDVVESENMA